jgi:prophage antirepressor-like protein
MDGLNTLNFEGHPLNVVIRDREPWWPAKEVGNILGLKGHGGQITQSLDKDEINVISTDVYRKQGRAPLYVNESGLYALIMKSRKPEAKRFRKWVTFVVLPSIRRTGTYSVPEQPKPDFCAQWSADRYTAEYKKRHGKHEYIRLLDEYAEKHAAGRDIFEAKLTEAWGIGEEPDEMDRLARLYKDLMRACSQNLCYVGGAYQLLFRAGFVNNVFGTALVFLRVPQVNHRNLTSA